MNNRARFNGRPKKMALLPPLSPAKAGLEILSRAGPRAALRSTSFRCACPGLNSTAGHAGLLSGSIQNVLCLSAITLILVCFEGCSKPAASQNSNAQSPTTANVRSSADVVKVQVAPVSISAGGNADTSVTLSISPGFHVNANPATFDYLIATNVTAGKSGGISAGKPIYPPAEKKKFQFAPELLAVYEGDAKVLLPLHAASNATKETRSLPLDVRVQACDQEKCLPPDTLHARITVEVK